MLCSSQETSITRQPWSSIHRSSYQPLCASDIEPSWTKIKNVHSRMVPLNLLVVTLKFIATPTRKKWVRGGHNTPFCISRGKIHFDAVLYKDSSTFLENCQQFLKIHYWKFIEGYKTSKSSRRILKISEISLFSDLNEKSRHFSKSCWKSLK